MSKFKTQPKRHQIDCLNKHGRQVAFALAAEQGTGKTWIVINNIADLWASGDLNGVLVFAPNGVHYNWDLIEIPKHMPDWVRMNCASWTSNPTVADRAAIESLFSNTDSTQLRIFLMNNEALQHKSGVDAATRFAQSCSKLMIVSDESSAFKNPKADRTKALLKLKPHSKWRRIMNGTLAPNGPFDLFSQYLFLDEDILGTTSYFAFKNEYAEIMQKGHPLLEHIMGRGKPRMNAAQREAFDENVNDIFEMLVDNGRDNLIEQGEAIRAAAFACDYAAVAETTRDLRNLLSPKPSKRKTMLLKLIANLDHKIGAQLLMQENKPAFAKGRIPQIVERDKDGLPKYRNLEKLGKLIAPYTFRVLKKDCLDLPDKIYKTVWFDLTDEQRKVYRKAEKEFRLALDGEDTPFNKLVAQHKLMQITSGYYLHPDAEEPVRIDGANPKLDLLTERATATLEGQGKLIVWARYQVQLADVARALRDSEMNVVEYHGAVGKRERQEAIDSFENGDADVFVGQQQAGGRGLTLVAASEVFYFSNTFALDDRQQTEDRAHRIGQEKNVTYTDFCARSTIDYEVIERIRSKEVVSTTIMEAMR